MKDYNGFTAEQRSTAGDWMRSQYRLGTRLPPSCCMACGQTEGIIHTHCEDYSEPYGDHLWAFPLCWTCHMMLHSRWKFPDEWKRYRMMVSAGWKSEAVHRHNFSLLNPIRRSLWTDMLFTPVAESWKVLDWIDAGIFDPRKNKEAALCADPVAYMESLGMPSRLSISVKMQKDRK